MGKKKKKIRGGSVGGAGLRELRLLLQPVLPEHAQRRRVPGGGAQARDQGDDRAQEVA